LRGNSGSVSSRQRLRLACRRRPLPQTDISRGFRNRTNRL